MRTQFKNSGIPVASIRAETGKMDEVSIRNVMAQKYAIDGHNMIAITDAAGLILYVNDLFCEVSEYDRSELIGKSMTILNSGYHPKSFWSGMWSVIAGGFIWREDIMNRNKRGNNYWVDTTIVPIINTGGFPDKYITILSDVTSRKKSEEFLTLARDTAESSSRSKGDFLTTISRESQVPMGGIIDMVEMMSATQLSKEQQSYVTIIKECAESLSDIITDILDFSSMEYTRSSIDNEDFSPAILARGVYSLMYDRATKKGLDIQLEVDNEVSRYVHGDAGKIRQILVNLVSNAIKYTNSGRVKISVSESLGTTHSILFEVSDTGIGISDTEAEAIFQPLLGESKNEQGAGLGLPSSKKMLDIIGGEIWFESFPRTGTTFGFSVPALVSKQPNQGAWHDESSTPRILVVSQSEEICKSSAINLSDAGMIVDESNSGKKAISAIMNAANTGSQYHVVIIDAALSDVTAFNMADLIRALRDINHPKLVLIGAISYHMNKKALSSGFSACIRRPYKDADFTDYIKGITDPATIQSCESETLVSNIKHNILISADPEDSELISEVASNLGFSTYLAKTAVDLENAMGAINFSMAIISLQVEGAAAVIDNVRRRESGLGMNAIPIVAIVNDLTGARDRYSELGLNEIVSSPVVPKKVKNAISRWTPESNHESAVEVWPSLADSITNVESGNVRILPTASEQVSTVLIVDPDQSTRKMLRKFLESDTCIIKEAQNGTDAIALCKKAAPDVVLMDCNMPIIDGFNATAAIKSMKKGKDIHVLIMTGMNDEVSANRAMSVGASDFIQKPVYLPVLRQRLHNIMTMKEAQRHVLHLAYHDRLTSLPNRIMFDDRISRALSAAKRTNSKVAVMFMDLDRFKNVNDNLGHLAGDELLKQAAVRMAGVLREQDTLARMGGDEFTVLLPDVQSTQPSDLITAARGVAERIIEVMNRTFIIDGNDVHVGVSIGISVSPEDGDDPSILLKNADTALYASKESGRNNFTFYSSKMHENLKERIRLEGGLRKALEREEIEVHYQPQVNIISGKVTGIEALARWKHEGEYISPVRFIPIAEDTGLIMEIGEFILNEACRRTADFNQANNTKLAVSVNLSPQQFTKSNLGEVLAKSIKDSGIEPSLLDLEITESLAMRNMEKVQSTLATIKQMGCRVSMDDFGTGYCSLSYLKKFPIDILKVDRSFISEVIHDQNDAAIVEAIIAMAKALDLVVIAEGVESQEQMVFLEDRGCDCAQGFLLHKPVKFDDLQDWMLKRGVAS